MCQPTQLTEIRKIVAAHQENGEGDLACMMLYLSEHRDVTACEELFIDSSCMERHNQQHLSRQTPS